MQKLVKKKNEKKLNENSFATQFIDKKKSKLKTFVKQNKVVEVSSNYKNSKNNLNIQNIENVTEPTIKSVSNVVETSSNSKTIVNLNSFEEIFYINKEEPLLKLNIYIAPNNVFCHLKDIRTNTVIKSVSGGLYKINVSKRGIRAFSKQIIHLFFNDLHSKNYSLNKTLAIKIVAPLNLRKSIFAELKSQLFNTVKKNILIDIPAKKVFNGCRACKQIRKKRKGIVLFQ